jgi:hypothetical protein
MNRRHFLTSLALAPTLPLAAKLPALPAPAAFSGDTLSLDHILASLHQLKQNRAAHYAIFVDFSDIEWGYREAVFDSERRALQDIDHLDRYCESHP